MKTILFLISFCFVLSSCNKNDKEITSGEWEVVSVTPSGSSITINATDSYLLNLDKKSFFLRLDVNSASGKIQIRKKGEIKFYNEILMTQVCCDSEFAENLLEQLIRMTEYKIENDKLMFSGNGKITLKRK